MTWPEGHGPSQDGTNLNSLPPVTPANGFSNSLYVSLFVSHSLAQGNYNDNDAISNIIILFVE